MDANQKAVNRFELTLAGYNGSTDKTDHLIIWLRTSLAQEDLIARLSAAGHFPEKVTSVTLLPAFFPAELQFPEDQAKLAERIALLDQEAKIATQQPTTVILAYLWPQEYRDHEYRDLGDSYEIDVTDAVLGLSAKEIQDMEDDTDSTNDLVTAADFAFKGQHRIVVVEAICEYFGVAAITEVTQEAVDAARKLVGIHPETDQGELAEAEFVAYDFGDGVQVLDHYRWDTSDSADHTKIAFLQYDDDKPDADSHKVTFHVRFNPDGSVNDAYALEVQSGNHIGTRHVEKLMEFSNTQATKEGWGLFHVSSSADVDGPRKLQRDDELEIFETDDDAMLYVATMACQGSQYHKDAIAFLLACDRVEYDKFCSLTNYPNVQAAAVAQPTPPQYQDEEVTGLDNDGCVTQWDADKSLIYTSGESLEEFGLHNLREHELVRVGVTVEAWKASVASQPGKLPETHRSLLLVPSGRFITDMDGRKVAEMYQPGDSPAEREAIKSRLVRSFNALPDLVAVLLRADKDGAIWQALDNEGITDSYDAALSEAVKALGDEGVTDIAHRYELDTEAIRAKVDYEARTGSNASAPAITS